jgi:hypothetical protein
VLYLIFSQTHLVTLVATLSDKREAAYTEAATFI